MAESRARSLANLANQNVLSVDSSSLDVGISSASPDSDLNVGSSIKMDGPSGVVTATSFVGDGSGLIGVASTDNIITGTAATFNNVVDVNGQLDVGNNIKIGNAGVITATSFTGDGANLTNVGVDTATVDTGSLKVSGISTLTGYVSLGSTVGAAGSIYFPDNKGINFGDAAEGDLQILHNGTDSIVQDVGTGKLVLKGNTAVEIRGTNNADLGVFNQGGSVRLYHSGNERFQTNTDGFEVIHAGGASTSRFLAGGSVGVGIGVTTTTGRDAAAGVGTVTGQIVFNETTGAVECYTGTSWQQLSNVSTATGGDTTAGVAPGNGYQYHVWTSPGTLVVEGGSITADMLLVAGGGGGAGGMGGHNHGGGGGGAGGIAEVTAMPLDAGTYPITVPTSNASGGNGQTSTNAPQGSDGGNVTVANTPAGTITAEGGGGGGTGPSASTGRNGGSGGGGGSFNNSPGGSATQPGTNPSPLVTDYGNAGGVGGDSSADASGGGGGGANGAGGSTSEPNVAGNGGNGRPFSNYPYPLYSAIVPSPFQPNMSPSVGPTGLFGGGGGGGKANSGSGGNGGPGGGGSGGLATGSKPGNAAQDGTGGGGGGGGGGNGGEGGNGGQGGRGIVIMRLQL